jgi:hypothetical protein
MLHRGFDSPARGLRDRRPFVCTHHIRDERGLKVYQRIASLFRGEDLRRLVGLRVLPRMTAESRHGETQKNRPLIATHVRDGRDDELGGLLRVRSIAIEHSEVCERREVGGDVAAGRLQVRGDRDAVPVVFDVEQHRQSLGGGERQRRPETVRCAGSVTAMNDGDAPVVGGIAKDIAPIANRLRPARRGRVLRPHSSARGKRGGAPPPRPGV